MLLSHGHLWGVKRGLEAAIADAIAACGLPASVRGEALTLTEFAALTDALAERK